VPHPLQVGLVGANAKQSWAKLFHSPAIKALPGLALAAVASAMRKLPVPRDSFGVDQYYASATELVHPLSQYRQWPSRRYSFHFSGHRDERAAVASWCHPYGFQAGELHLEATAPFAAAEPPAVPELRGVPANIGGLYQHFARDIRTGENTSPSFGHALKLHKLIRSIGIAADYGIRQTSGDWPTE